MSQDVPAMFEMPMTFATDEFGVFVAELSSYLEQIKKEGLAPDRTARIERMCVFYTNLLAKMTDAVRCIKYGGSDKKHYKYDLRKCKKAHEELMTTDEHREETDELVMKPAFAHLDAYVWRILSECYYLLTHVYVKMDSMQVFLVNFQQFIDQKTKQLNETKKDDMLDYIHKIESMAQNLRLDDMTDMWKLQTLITFTEGVKPVVWGRDWYIQPFAFALPTSGGPREGGHYATFSKEKKFAHVPCDDIGGLLTRMQNL